MSDDLTTNEAAAVLNTTPRHVRALIRGGSLPAEKRGRGWAIEPETVEFEGLLVRSKEAQLEQLRLTDPEKFATMTGAIGGSGIWSWIDILANRDDLAPPWGSFHRSKYLKQVWQGESKLAGVLFSMQSRIAVTGWTVTGPVTGLQSIWRLFADAEEEGWIYLIRPVCEDYLTTDVGGVVQVARGDDGNVGHLYHLPGGKCIPGPVKWKDKVWDLLFLDVDGQWKGFEKRHFYRLCSMPSTDPLYRKLGFCFMSRVLRSARLAGKLFDYKEEKLSNLPPEGIATVTGLTRTQVDMAITLYEEARKQHKSLTFPGVLWLVANTFGQEAKVDFAAFRSVWDGFNDEAEAEVYMKTVSLDAGTDVGEFWHMDVTGATRAAGERAHRKSLGKGPNEFMVDFERFVARILPELYHWRFDEMDDEQDALVERIRAARIANIMELWRADPVAGKGLISTEQAQELLALWRVVPQRFFQPQEALLTDILRELSGGLTIGTINHYGFVTVHRQYWQLDGTQLRLKEPPLEIEAPPVIRQAAEREKITIQMPEQPPTQVTVEGSQFDIRLPKLETTLVVPERETVINFPEQPATQLNLEAPIIVEPPVVNVNVEPTQVVVEAAQISVEPAQVNVEAPQIVVESAQVTVEPQIVVEATQVNVEPTQVVVEPADVNVTVEPADVNVVVEPTEVKFEPRITLQAPDETIEVETVVTRDKAGLIKRIRKSRKRR